MPRVGSSRIRTLGSVISHFDSTTFCWLPPESWPRLLIDVGAADPHPVAVVAGRLQFADIVDHPPRGDLVQACQGDVLAHVIGEDQAELLAVLGDIGKAGVDRRRTLESSTSRPSSRTRPLMLRPQARPNRLIANSVRPAPIRPAMPTTSPRRTLKVDILDHLPLGMERMVHRPVLHHQHRIADLRVALRKAVGKVAVDHAADDPVLFHRLAPAIDAVDGTAVAQHRDAVGDAGDLVQLVRNQDRGDALLPERHQPIEQRRAVGLVQAGGRLVQDQTAAPAWRAPSRSRPVAACRRRDR